MEEAIEKARILIEALPYIRSFRDKIVVVKLGGSAMDSGDALDTVLQDIVFMETVGMRPILVHGGGPEISKEMKRRGLKPKFVKGHRVTDAETIDIVADVLRNKINPDIVSRIKKLGGMAEGVTNEDGKTLRARKKTIVVDGEEIDLGFVGEMVGVDCGLLFNLCLRGVVPVIAPVAADETGQKLNVQADSVAAFIASQLRPEKIVFLSDTHGIRTDPNDPESFASSLSEQELAELIEKGIIDGGMLPKVEGCLLALQAGVTKAHIIDGRIPHALLLEIFTDKGIGTQIVQ